MSQTAAARSASAMVNGIAARADGVILRVGYSEEQFDAAVLAVGPIN